MDIPQYLKTAFGEMKKSNAEFFDGRRYWRCLTERAEDASSEAVAWLQGRYGEECHQRIYRNNVYVSVPRQAQIELRNAGILK